MPREVQLTTSERCLFWLVAHVLLVAGIAWVAFQMQQDEIAPAVLFPIAAGTVLGLGGLAISRATAVRRRWLVCVAAVVSGLLVVIAQDYIGHRHRLRLYADEVQRRLLVADALEGDGAVQTRFTQYLVGKVRDEPVWWTLDALLTSGAALAVVAWRVRSPSSEPPRQAQA